MAKLKGKKGAARNSQAAPGTADSIRQPMQSRSDILVKAIRTGYYNLTRFREGDTFFLNSEEDFSNRWMVAVEGNREENEAETDRLTKIANATRRKAAADRAFERATFTKELNPAAEQERADQELQEALSQKTARPAAGSDYERHEDVRPTDNQGAEPRGGRASDKSVA